MESLASVIAILVKVYSILEGCGEKIWPDYCSDLHLAFVNDSESNLNYSTKTVELFSADTEDLKFCQMQYNFSSCKNVTVSVYPGKKFNVSLIAVGTFNLPVSTKISHKVLFPTDDKIELR